MKFKDTELLPGVIIEAEDPKKLGRVKATVPGLFDGETMNIEGMPWIYPLMMNSYQHFSKMLKGSKIWVFKQDKNYKEFWYIPMFELNQNTRDIVADYDYPEILISRDVGDASVLAYYTDDNGIMLQIGNDNFINIKPDTSITLHSGTAQIDLKDGKVYIGDGNAEEVAVLGNTLQNVLSTLATDLKNCSNACVGPLSALKAPLLSAHINLNKGIQKILCSNTLVN